MKPKILVVDDEPDALEVLGFKLKESGYAPIFAKDGARAITVARDERPALIVLDLKMPRMNGMELLAALMADVRYRHIPVMLMTSSEQPEDIAAAYRLGVNAYVRKPLLFDDLVSTMRHVLGFWLDVNLLPTGDVA